MELIIQIFFKTVIKGDDIYNNSNNLPITIKTYTTTIYQTEQLNLYLLTSSGRVILNNQPITITLKWCFHILNILMKTELLL